MDQDDSSGGLPSTQIIRSGTNVRLHQHDQHGRHFDVAEFLSCGVGVKIITRQMGVKALYLAVVKYHDFI